MRVVKAERWHRVDAVHGASPTGASGVVASGRCSVCGSSQLSPHDRVVMDGVSQTRYSVVRCAGCGYDLLEPLLVAQAAAL